MQAFLDVNVLIALLDALIPISYHRDGVRNGLTLHPLEKHSGMPLAFHNDTPSGKAWLMVLLALTGLASVQCSSCWLTPNTLQ